MSATFVCQGVGVAWSSKQSKMTQPDLDFVAPDIQLAPTTTTTTSTSTSTAAAAAAAAAAASADVFSYGLLVCAVYTDSGVTCSGVFRYVQLCSGVSRCDVYTCGLLVCAVFTDSGRSLVHAEHNVATYARQIDKVRQVKALIASAYRPLSAFKTVRLFPVAKGVSFMQK